MFLRPQSMPSPTMPTEHSMTSDLRTYLESYLCSHHTLDLELSTGYRKRIPTTDLSDEFIHRWEVSQHLIQIRENPYVSQHCGKSPVEEAYLRRHNEIHTTGKLCEGEPLVISSASDHTCWLTLEGNHLNIIYMKKAFCKTNHSIHNWMSTGEKPYKCRDIGKAFSLCSYLRQHERTHKERNSVNVS